MSFLKHIEYVLDTFFLSTHTPIQAFDYSGYPISTKGYDQTHERIFNKHNIYQRSKKKLKSSLTFKEIQAGKDSFFTSLSICGRSLNRGIFIIGPYSHEKTNKFNLVYKPEYLIDHLTVFLRMIYAKNQWERPLNVKEQAYSLHVKKAMDYVDARYNESISLDKISSYLDLNKSYFCTLFKDETGETFTEYLNKTRIEKSKPLLLDDKYSILEVALNVGFNNQNYFNIIFKKLTGTTPMEYKKEYTPQINKLDCPLEKAVN